MCLDAGFDCNFIRAQKWPPFFPSSFKMSVFVELMKAKDYVLFCSSLFIFSFGGKCKITFFATDALKICYVCIDFDGYVVTATKEVRITARIADF